MPLHTRSLRGCETRENLMAVERAKSLAQLIADRKGERSFAMLESAAGGKPTASRWHQYVSGPLKNAPDFDAVPGMAIALGVDEWTVWDAVGISCGLPPRGTDDVELLLRLRGLRRRGGRGLKDLTRREVDALVAVAEALLAAGMDQPA